MPFGWRVDRLRQYNGPCQESNSPANEPWGSPSGEAPSPAVLSFAVSARRAPLRAVLELNGFNAVRAQILIKVDPNPAALDALAIVSSQLHARPLRRGVQRGVSTVQKAAPLRAGAVSGRAGATSELGMRRGMASAQRAGASALP